MTKLRGLGKGLDALLGASEVDSEHLNLNVHEISLDKIMPGKFQPRQVFDEDSLSELADSIKHSGIIQPIVVRKHANHYEIIAGERRFRASKLAGVKKIPVIIREFSNEEALAVAIIENVQRKDLNVIEEAMGYRSLIDEFKLTHDDIARVTGRSRSHISNLLRLLNLHATVQEMVMREDLSMGHARALIPLAESSQLALAKIILEDGLTTAEVERRVAKLLHDKSSTKISAYQVNDPDISSLETRIADRLGMMVAIRHNRSGRGRVTLSYNSLEELDSLLSLIE